MTRNRSRPVQKEQSKGLVMPATDSDSSFAADGVVQKARSTSFFSVPGVFVGLSTKGLPDSESAKSPTSPLDSKVFSNRGSSLVRSPRSPGPEGRPRSWHCSKVGLGLVDSLNDESKVGGKVLGFSENRNLLLGPQMKISIPTPKALLDAGIRDELLGAATGKSLPENVGTSAEPGIGVPSSRSCRSKLAIGSKEADLEHGEFGKKRSWSADIGGSSLPPPRFMYHNRKSGSEMFPSESKNSKSDSPPLVRKATNFGNFSGSLPISFGSSRGFMASLSASEIELSEDYTCIISHGPNPKKTHIFGDCILESHTIRSPDSRNKVGKRGAGFSWLVECPDQDSPPCPSNDFLSNCFSCKKKLEGKDIYMYRGEKAFCSCNCRDQEILIEEEMEKPATDSSDSPCSSFHEEIFLAGMAVAS